MTVTRRTLTALLLAAPFGLAHAATVPAAPAGTELLMIERQGCIYCKRWREEVMPEYALTAEGRAAPLRVVDIDGPWPDGLVIGSRPVITPTFILLQDGREVARLEGYPGEDHFWPLLGIMLRDAGVALPPASGG